MFWSLLVLRGSACGAAENHSRNVIATACKLAGARNRTVELSAAPPPPRATAWSARSRCRFPRYGGCFRLVASPADMTRELQQFITVLPPQAAHILTAEMTSLADRHSFTLGVGALVSGAVTSS